MHCVTHAYPWYLVKSNILILYASRHCTLIFVADKKVTLITLPEPTLQSHISMSPIWTQKTLEKHIWSLFIR